jgi:hypothetical protein
MELGTKWPVNLACDSDFHINHRVLLRAANLRHGTDGFTSPLKEGMLWIFSPEKSDGFDQEASMTTEAAIISNSCWVRFMRCIFWCTVYSQEFAYSRGMKSFSGRGWEYIYSGPSSYDWPDIRTTLITTKILVLTYDQNLELRPECRSRPKRLCSCKQKPEMRS